MTDEARKATTAELAIAKARAGELSPQTALWTLAATALILPTPDDSYDGDLTKFVPLLVGRDGVTFLAAFTDPDQIGDYLAKAPQFMAMNGADLVRWMPAGVGLAVNPGGNLGFELPPEGLEAFRAEL